MQAFVRFRNRSRIGPAADAGATIFPVMPAFYAKPVDSEEMAKNFVDRVLAHFGLPQPEAFVWRDGSR